jgi:hypothetical protein
MNRLRSERRDAAMEAYGGRCATCGNNDRTELNIVPKKGWRWPEGAPVGGDTRARLRWLDQQDYPDTHTLVCGPMFSPCRRALQLVQ